MFYHTHSSGASTVTQGNEENRSVVLKTDKPQQDSGPVCLLTFVRQKDGKTKQKAVLHTVLGAQQLVS